MLSRDQLIMFGFSLIILWTAYRLLHSNQEKKVSFFWRFLPKPIRLPIKAYLTGSFLGFMGGGGGFLIVPALHLIGELSMQEAVATSLAIISFQSILGAITDPSVLKSLDVFFLVLFLILSSMGMKLGILLGERIQGEKLKKYFAYFVLLMGCLTVIKETLGISH